MEADHPDARSMDEDEIPNDNDQDELPNKDDENESEVPAIPDRPKSFSSFPAHRLIEMGYALMITFSQEQLVEAVGFMKHLKKHGKKPKSKRGPKKASNSEENDWDYETSTSSKKESGKSTTLISSRKELIWEQLFQQLVQYKRDHSNCDIPRDYANNKELAVWADKQKRLHKGNKLPAEKVKRLSDLGFNWEVPMVYKRCQDIANMSKEDMWEFRFTQLCQFKNEEGHCNVATGYKNKSLVDWCCTQRRNNNKGKLSLERYERLNVMGFEWSMGKSPDMAGKSADAVWDMRYGQLVEFLRLNGHTNVPKGYRNKPLAMWVNSQRWRKKAGKVTENRIARLDQLGFEWDRTGKSNVRFAVK